jgi:hypothetical protein
VPPAARFGPRSCRPVAQTTNPTALKVRAHGTDVGYMLRVSRRRLVLMALTVQASLAALSGVMWPVVLLRPWPFDGFPVGSVVRLVVAASGPYLLLAVVLGAGAVALRRRSQSSAAGLGLWRRGVLGLVWLLNFGLVLVGVFVLADSSAGIDVVLGAAPVLLGAIILVGLVPTLLRGT